MVIDNTSSNILARSRNIYDRLDAIERTVQRNLNSLELFWSILGLFMMLHEPIVAWFNRKSRLPSPSLASVVIGLLIVAVGVVIKVLGNKSLNNVMSLYKGYCSSESLIVEAGWVYGHTDNSAVQLDFTQISQASTKREYSSLARIQQGFTLEVLEIQDKEGKIYQFLSFANSSELQACIERYITP